MYDFHDSNDIYENPSFLPFFTLKGHPNLALKIDIWVPKRCTYNNDFNGFKIIPRNTHGAWIIHILQIQCLS